MDRVKIFRMITTAALLISFAGVAGAQEYVAPTVEVSNQKVKKDGKVYYSHVVQERQTLYSISRAYNVTQDEILEANPGLREYGLKKNSIIMIPTQSQIPAAEVIPQPEENVVEQDNDQTPAHKIHVVKWYETLHDIAARYNVSESAIIAANNLKEGKVKNRQKLIIPTEGYTEVITTETSEEDEEDMDLETAFDDKEVEEEEVLAIVPKNHIQATVLLPFKATGTTSSKSNMDFYSGVLLAVKELGETGLDIDMSVYDIADGSYGATKEELESSDMIIGPISDTDISGIYSVAPEIKALISPLDPKAELLSESICTMVHAPASRMAQYEDLAQWIKEDLVPGDTVIVISEKASRGEARNLLRTAIDSAKIRYISIEYSILEGRRIQQTLEDMMTPEGTNRIVIASESEAFVNDALRNLNLTVHDKFNVVLYAPARIRTFDTIEIEHFHHVNLHACLTYYIDYTDEAVVHFVKSYRGLFNSDPSQFAFQGYDVAKYFLSMCAKYGDAWMHYVEDTQMLQSIFKIRPTENGGYINNGIKRIIYEKEYTVKTLN